jgi:hypothetical protein
MQGKLGIEFQESGLIVQRWSAHAFSLSFGLCG